jgi:hypothetical protein
MQVCREQILPQFSLTRYYYLCECSVHTYNSLARLCNVCLIKEVFLPDPIKVGVK